MARVEHSPYATSIFTTRFEQRSTEGAASNALELPLGSAQV